MTAKLKILIIFLTALISMSWANHESPNSYPLPRPLILEYPDENFGVLERESNEDLVELECTSWRFAVETNNLSPWKTIPEECGDYVKNYLMGRAYKMDLDRVNNEASAFAKSVRVGDDGKDVWVFDIDETLISNLPYYAHHGYGMELFDHNEFDKWVEKGMGPAIESSLRLYEEVLAMGFKVFLLTGRSEAHREITTQNLMNVGFKNWVYLILRGPNEKEKAATVYKSEKRDEMVKEGYRILGNSGDQWSDLLGSSMSTRSFKLPNPMYYIP